MAKTRIPTGDDIRLAQSDAATALKYSRLVPSTRNKRLAKRIVDRFQKLTWARVLGKKVKIT